MNVLFARLSQVLDPQKGWDEDDNLKSVFA